MRALKNFIFYNNTVPIIFGVLFLGTSLTFAASEDAREAVVSSEQVLTSVDNTFIRNVNLDTYDIEVFVNSVEEDDEYYYVSYTVGTIGLVDGVWQPVTEIRELQISKEALGDNDLGLRVSKELSDIYENEKRVLRETQEIEKNIGQTNKVITTKYNGIVGRVLDPENEVFPGYDPVVTPPLAIPGPKPKQFTEELDNGQTVIIENQRTSDTETVQTPQSSGSEGSTSTPATTSPATTGTLPAATSTPPTETESPATTTAPAEQEPEPPATSTPPTEPSLEPDPPASTAQSVEPEPETTPESPDLNTETLPQEPSTGGTSTPANST